MRDILREYDKNYYECYARQALIALLDTRYGDLIHGESPDLQGVQLSMGIEVTRSVSQNEAQLLVTIADFEVQSNQLEKSIARKTERLNSIYRLFESNRLYIFAETAYLDEAWIRRAVRGAYSSPSLSALSLRYDVLYIDCLDRLFWYHASDGGMGCIPIHSDMMKRLHTLAKRQEWTD